MALSSFSVNMLPSGSDIDQRACPLESLLKIQGKEIAYQKAAEYLIAEFPVQMELPYKVRYNASYKDFLLLEMILSQK